MAGNIQPTAVAESSAPSARGKASRSGNADFEQMLSAAKPAAKVEASEAEAVALETSEPEVAEPAKPGKGTARKATRGAREGESQSPAEGSSAAVATGEDTPVEADGVSETMPELAVVLPLGPQEETPEEPIALDEGEAEPMAVDATMAADAMAASWNAAQPVAEVASEPAVVEEVAAVQELTATTEPSAVSTAESPAVEAVGGGKGTATEMEQAVEGASDAEVETEASPVEETRQVEDIETTEEPPFAEELRHRVQEGERRSGSTSPVTPARDPEVGQVVPTTSATVGQTKEAALTTPAQTPVPQETRFADDNHPTIVRSIQSNLLPKGGAMRIRLDPPEIGALQVRVEMRDGVMTALFQTSSDDATRLLSHSLNQLKHSLESQGVSVGRLQVEQAPRGQDTGASHEEGQQQPQDQSMQQEQQRREMLRRMWRKLANGNDPLDMMG